MTDLIFAGKSSMHYFVFFVAIFNILFCISTAIYAVSTDKYKHKYRWAIFSLIGVSSLRMNWDTGAWAFQALAIHITSASIVSAGHESPWFISIALPLGAIMYWARAWQETIGTIGRRPRFPTDNE